MSERGKLSAISGIARRALRQTGRGNPKKVRHIRIGLVLVGASLFLAFAPPNASAIPSFARQTGLPCGVCHQGFPELTAFGRQFKLNGYTMESNSALAARIAFMLQPSYTHTASAQPVIPAAHFERNNNWAISQASVFYGGKIYDKVGAFSQVTLDGVADTEALDNTDIRFADSTTVGGKSLVYGLTLNNNPTVQDLWNTTPAWGYPFESSSLAPSPAAATLVEGALAGQVAGLGAYFMWNKLLYVEITGYRTLPLHVQNFIGTKDLGETQIDGIAPYWRVVLQHDWGKHYLSVGTLGFAPRTYPGRDQSAGSDRYTDIGFDVQYQYSGEYGRLSVLGSYIHEKQHWKASQPLGNAANSNDTLNSFRQTVSYLFKDTYGAMVTHFSVTGRSDANLYSPGSLSGSRTNSPDSDGYIFELKYYPFNNGGPKVWQWFNMKLALQYIVYDKFNGSRQNYDGFGRNASDNNTVYLACWLMF